MAIVTINLPHEIRVRLKEVPNQSGLIAMLLNEYFNTSTISHINAEIERIKAKANYDIQKLKGKRERLKEFEEIEEQKKKEREIMKEHTSDIRNIILEGIEEVSEENQSTKTQKKCKKRGDI